MGSLKRSVLCPSLPNLREVRLQDRLGRLVNIEEDERREALELVVLATVPGGRAVPEAAVKLEGVRFVLGEQVYGRGRGELESARCEGRDGTESGVEGASFEGGREGSGGIFEREIV